MSKYKNKRGRPTVMTPKKLALLQHAFDIGATDEEACTSAQISTSTLYNYQTENPGFLEEKEARKRKPVLLAKETIFNALSTDVNVAKWYLERKKKDEFSLYVIKSNKQEDKAMNRILDDPRTLKTLAKSYEALVESTGYRVEYVKIDD